MLVAKMAPNTVVLGALPAMRRHVYAQLARGHGDGFLAVRAGPFKANASRPKVVVSRCVENLPHSLAAYAEFPGDAGHVLVLAALSGSNDTLSKVVLL